MPTLEVITLPVLRARLRNQSREPVTASMNLLKLRLSETLQPRLDVSGRTSVKPEGNVPLRIRASCTCTEATTVAARFFVQPPVRLCRLVVRSEEHTSELQSLAYLVCRL